MLIYTAIGASFLWPWNCLMTASTFLAPYFHSYPALERSYSSCILLFSTCVNLIISSWLALKPEAFAWRIRFGQTVIAVGFVIMSLCTLLDLDPVIYFFAIMGIVLFISVGTTHVQNGVTAITQRIPGGREARAVLIGQALSGIVPPIFGFILGLSGTDISNVRDAIRRTVRTAFDTSDLLASTSPDVPDPIPALPNNTNTAIVLFMSSAVLCLYVLYGFRGPRIKVHIDLSEEESEHIHAHHSLWELFGALKSPGTAIFMSFAVSLSYAVFANIVQSKVIPQRFFCPLTHFVWNSGDLAGRVLCESEFFRIRKPRTLVYYGYIRILFIPTLLLMSWAGNFSDVFYLVVMLAYGLTSGHLVSSAISYAPSCVSVEQRASAGGLIGMIISFGLVSGSIISFFIAFMV